ncbi:MAG: hypothetical protein JWM68_2757 [Verrucomicrobiales bacterium]|nr:hypothetical protein [Verrucomicrobiales bacterium]
MRTLLNDAGSSELRDHIGMKNKMHNHQFSRRQFLGASAAVTGG